MITLRKLAQYAVVAWASLLTIEPPALAVIPSGSGFHLLVRPCQPAFGVNLDGVARIQFDGQTECTAALISDSHLVSAAHCFDEDADGSIDFGADAALLLTLENSSRRFEIEFTSDDVTIPSNWAARSADVSVIQLNSSAPDSFPRYPVYGGRDELGKAIIVVGYGFTGTGSVGASFHLDDKLAGLNRYEALGASIPGERIVPMPATDMLVYDFDSGLAANNTLAAMGLDSDLGFDSDEVKSADGDSGGPVFIDGAIAGISSFGEWGFKTDFDPDAIGTWGELSFTTRLSSFQDFVLNATDGHVVIVPEPCTLILLGIGVAVVLGLNAIRMVDVNARN